MQPAPQHLIRDMRSGDLATVVAIERNAHISPWGRISFEESLNQGHICRCIWQHQALLAYSVVQRIEDELHILNVVVTPSEQGQGWAHVLMNDIFTVAQNDRVKTVFLDVRESNTKAQSLYKKWGFGLLAVRKQYYRAPVANERENALVFMRTL
ncbi:MAG: ribosomal protein S18-alanine N-acetyltransferase [Arenicella sp.]|jgi:ribosomal-protein-alanine N-acetyltransferase|nr:ribosomal protein S18-alanine N-acetyltransferase [Arenicella sp.]HAU68958.1 ribosomal-protein-alanine N-acetyltransferase [Gammaproteobacteria bacterium]